MVSGASSIVAAESLRGAAGAVWEAVTLLRGARTSERLNLFEIGLHGRTL